MNKTMRSENASVASPHERYTSEPMKSKNCKEVGQMRYLPTGNKKIVWRVNVSITTITSHVLTQVFSVLVL